MHTPWRIQTISDTRNEVDDNNWALSRALAKNTYYELCFESLVPPVVSGKHTTRAKIWSKNANLLNAMWCKKVFIDDFLIVRIINWLPIPTESWASSVAYPSFCRSHHPWQSTQTRRGQFCSFSLLISLSLPLSRSRSHTFWHTRISNSENFVL
jgi:hypothetical protein